MDLRRTIKEELEDFDWIKNAEWWRGFTLGDLYDNNKINVGDKIHVNGYTRGEDGDDTYIDSYVEITDVPKRDWGYDGLEYVQFKTDRQTLNNILKGLPWQLLGRTLNFTNNDRDLKVLDYQSKINESEDFDWIGTPNPEFEMVVVDFPKNKYSIDDVDDFKNFIEENYPHIEWGAFIDPQDESYNDGSEGIRYWIAPSVWESDYVISWSTFYHDDDIELYEQMDWDEFRRANIVFPSQKHNRRDL
jgi:hypothetical protein